MKISTRFKIINLMDYLDPNVIKFKKENGISHAKYVELIKRDFEIVAQMSFDEIMQLSLEEYNGIAMSFDREIFRFDLAQDGYRYFTYKNVHFKKYLCENGNIDMDKVNEAYENSEYWEKFNELIIYRDASGKEFNANQLHLEDKYEELKKYFPGVNRIRVDEEKKHIVMDFPEMELYHVNVIISKLCVRGRFWENIGDNDECRYIKKALDELVKIDNPNLDDPVEFYLWTYFTPEGSNYVHGMQYISIGSQHYLNYIIDNIVNSKDRELLKQYTITSNMILLNPIAENATFGNYVSFCVKYQEQSERNKIVPYFVEYKDGDEEPLAKLGYEVARYDMKKKCFKEVKL